MDFFADFLHLFLAQLRSPTLGFLFGGMLLAAFNSRLTIPNAIYQFVVFVLLTKIGIEGGMEIREAKFSEMALPALFSLMIGMLIVVGGNLFFSILPNIKKEDGLATAGLFGAVSASTLAVALVALEEEGIFFEAWVPALYPFMDIPALILAIVMAKSHQNKKKAEESKRSRPLGVVKESLQGSALSALLFGLALGIFSEPQGVFESFFKPMFKGFLSILMLVLGMEAYNRLHELKRVAHWFVIYAFVGPIVHGLLAFGLGYLAHLWVGFSPGGVVILSVIAASNSDISGPPTLRAGIPSANPSAYIGSSTSVGTPVAIAVCIPMLVALAHMVFK